MKHHKIKNLLDNTLKQPSKFRKKYWIEINDESWGIYGSNNGIKFKASMITSHVCCYSDAYIHVKETITILNSRTAAALISNI